MPRVTAKQRRFLKELKTAPSATQAAIRAGYSPKSAENSAVKNTKKFASTIGEALINQGITREYMADKIIEILNGADKRTSARMIELIGRFWKEIGAEINHNNVKVDNLQIVISKGDNSTQKRVTTVHDSSGSEGELTGSQKAPAISSSN